MWQPRQENQQKATNLFTITTHIVCLFYACYKNNVHQVWNLKFAFLWPDPFFFFFFSFFLRNQTLSVCLHVLYAQERSSQLGERVPGILQTEILLHICYCILHTSSLWNHVLKTQFQPTWQCVWYYDECAMASVIIISLLQIKCACDVLMDTCNLQCSCTLS